MFGKRILSDLPDARELRVKQKRLFVVSFWQEKVSYLPGGNVVPGRDVMWLKNAVPHRLSIYRS